MKTLIELYDERPLENVLGAEMLKPERIVYLCTEPVARDTRGQKKLREYFRHRGLTVSVEYIGAKLYETDKLLTLLRSLVKKYPDCAIDISGGTDAALFAVGLLCAESDVPVFTYSRRKNTYYNIYNAPFGESLPCDLRFSIEDCFMMAGGAMRSGRVDNRILSKYMDDIEPFFQLYLANRRNWNRIVTYMQRVSQSGSSDGYITLDAKGDYVVKGERGSKISCPEDALKAMEKIDFIRNLKIVRNDYVSFRFRDSQIRTWLRDVGSVLELYVYKECLETGLFNDVMTSAIVDWEGDNRENAVTNELDVMCTRGVTPVFISCKTCDVKTEALNELAILRDRFGGKIAKAAIVTAERGGAAMRNRAEELDITVIDISDLSSGRIGQRIKSMMNNKK